MAYDDDDNDVEPSEQEDKNVAPNNTDVNLVWHTITFVTAPDPLVHLDLSTGATSPDRFSPFLQVMAHQLIR